MLRWGLLIWTQLKLRKSGCFEYRYHFCFLSLCTVHLLLESAGVDSVQAEHGQHLRSQQKQHWSNRARTCPLACCLSATFLSRALSVLSAYPRTKQREGESPGQHEVPGLSYCQTVLSTNEQGTPGDVWITSRLQCLHIVMIKSGMSVSYGSSNTFPYHFLWITFFIYSFS